MFEGNQYSWLAHQIVDCSGVTTDTELKLCATVVWQGEEPPPPFLLDQYENKLVCHELGHIIWLSALI